MHQRHRLAAVGKIVRVNASHRHAGIFARERRRIAGQNDELAGRNECADREGVTDPVGETNPAQFEVRAGDVFQFDELEGVAVVVRRVGRMIHDFGEQQAGEILDKARSLEVSQRGYLQLGGDETVGRGMVRMRWGE